MSTKQSTNTLPPHPLTTPFRALNTLLLLWCVVQISLYSWQLSLVPCPQVRALGIGYLLSYILYLLVPLSCLIITRCCNCSCNMISLIMVYCGIMIVVKIVCIVVVSTVGWRHVGMCYIANGLKIGVIGCSGVEMGVLGGEIWLLNYWRKYQMVSKSKRNGKGKGDSGRDETDRSSV